MATRISIKIDSKTIKATGDFVSLLFNLGKEARQKRLDHQNPYEVLGVPPESSIEQIKQRYRQLAKVFHPDMQNGDTSAMKRLNEAYDKICQEKKA